MGSYKAHDGHYSGPYHLVYCVFSSHMFCWTAGVLYLGENRALFSPAFPELVIMFK